jgi:hypothetical protein
MSRLEQVIRVSGYQVVGIRSSEYQVGKTIVFPDALVSWYPATWFPDNLISFGMDNKIWY